MCAPKILQIVEGTSQIRKVVICQRWPGGGVRLTVV